MFQAICCLERLTPLELTETWSRTTSREHLKELLSGTSAIPPPITQEGIAKPCGSLFSRYSTLSRYTSHTEPYRIAICLHAKQNNRGYRTSSCALKGIALWGGIAAIVSQYHAIPRHLFDISLNAPRSFLQQKYHRDTQGEEPPNHVGNTPTNLETHLLTRRI